MKCFAILLAEFFRQAYSKVSQFWEVLIFEPCLFSIRAYYQENTVVIQGSLDTKFITVWWTFLFDSILS